MDNVILIHGTCDKDEYYSDEFPSLSNSHWFPWIQKQLLIRDYVASTPEIPRAFEPEYEIWKKELERYEIDEKTTLVGHSCGGGFLLKWLSENKNKKIKKLILVAPWLDPEKQKTRDFFEFEIDPNLGSRTETISLFVSTDDDEDVLMSVAKIRTELPTILFQEFNNKGHFTFSSLGNTEEFPELLSEILK